MRRSPEMDRKAAIYICMAVALAVLVFAPSAFAGTMSQSGSTLTFTAAAGEQNSVTVSADGSGHIIIDDIVPISVGSSPCSSVNDTEVDCGVPSEHGYSGVSLLLEDGADSASFNDDLPLSTRRADGGPGDDTLNGSSEADTLIGGSGEDSINGFGGGDTVQGGDNNDTIDVTGASTATDTVDAGNGDDSIFANDGNPDALTCGAGTDQVDTDSSDTIGVDCEEDGSGNPLTHPTATTGSAIVDGPTSATLQGSGNPNGVASSYHFEYGTSTGYGKSTPSTSLGSDSTDHNVVADITGLAPSTLYHFRLVVTTDGGSVPGADATFTTAAAAASGGAIAATLTPGDCSALAALCPSLADFGFRGTILVTQSPTTFAFVWGLTPSDTFQFPAGLIPGSGLSGTGQQPVFQGFPRAVLPGGRTLHVHLLATDPSGTSNGGDVTFTTSTHAPKYGVPPIVGGDLPAFSAATQPGHNTQLGYCDPQSCAGSYDAQPTTITLPAVLVSDGVDSKEPGTGADIEGIGSLGPNIPPSAHLEYGLSTAYGKQTSEVAGTNSLPPVSFSGGVWSVADQGARSHLTFKLTGLQPATVYHARIDSTTYGGLAHSGDFVLITPPGKAGTTATVSGSVATVDYNCETKTACSGGVSLQTTGVAHTGTHEAAKTRRPVTIGRAKFRIRGHKKGKIRIKLTAKGKRLVRHKLRVEAIYKTHGHKTATPLTLRRKR